MEDYIKPSIRNPPDHFVLHVRTYDLSPEKFSMKIVESILSLACRLKNETHDVCISTIILRADDKNLNEKGMEVNLYSKELSKEKNICLLDKSTKIKSQHLNKGKLHLTKYGSRVLSNNFVNEIPQVLHWPIDRGNSDANSEECNSEGDLTAKKYDECNITLKTIGSDNVNKLIFAHLNINSSRKTFEFLATQVKEKIDILIISETKIDESFPKGNFLIEGFSTPYRLDRNSKGGEIMLCVRVDIPSNLLTFVYKPIGILFIELTLQNTKILINFSYNPYKSDIKKHLTVLKNYLDVHSSKYEKILILGDFNMEIKEANMESYCENYDLKSLIKQSTRYKNPNKPTSIDLILINVPRIFQYTCVLETGLSDFHLMTVTVMEKTFEKMHPRVINYRSYRDLSNKTFRVSLINSLSNKVLVNNDDRT